jgi:bifunctional DNA-binding transcriptional regulator/antitoxin component of YhaV-PrlF toxin-antitoxin module
LNTETLVLTIPKDIAQGMGWGKGDDIAITIGGANRLVLSKIQSQEIAPDLKSEKGTVIP